MLSLFQKSQPGRTIEVLVGPIGMQFLFNNSIRRDIRGAPSEMMSALIEVLDATEFKEISFSGSSLTGHVESPEKPKRRAKDGEKEEERFITLQFDDIFPNYSFKIPLLEEEVRELLLVFEYWLD